MKSRCGLKTSGSCSSHVLSRGVSLALSGAVFSDGGRRGDAKVLDLKHDAVVLGEGDDLAGVEAELLVVVEDGVHVLDPDGVDGAVEVHPLDLILLHPRLLRVGLRYVTDEHGADAVGPLTRLQVECAVELVHSDTLRVHLVDAHQRAEDLALAAARRPDEHHAVPHYGHLVELDALESEDLSVLQAALCYHVVQVGLELLVGRDGLLYAGEEVLNDGAEQDDVIAQELGQVGVTHRPQHLEVLLHVGVVLLEDASRHDDRVHSAHAEVVVVLAAELLRGEPEGGDELLREWLALVEAEGEETDLGDHRVVGHHHGHRTEERLEVVGQLGAACVAGVHRDEGASGAVDLDDRALEVELVQLHRHRVLYGEHLLRDDGEHLDVDPVELVEAGPRPRLEAVGTVEDDALLGEGLGEVLDALRLARARGAGGGAAQLDMQRPHKGHVAAVSERRDDETRAGAEILVADGDELVVREEVEAREGGALRLEIVCEILLHALELGVALDPLLLELLVVAEGDDERRRLDL
eukprot:scaffold24462_cov48-Phaeocystis_antarctica.AAC.3